MFCAEIYEGTHTVKSVFRNGGGVQRCGNLSAFPNKSQDIVKEYVDTLSFDKLPSLMEFLHGLLITSDKGPLVIYTHCEVCGIQSVCMCACVYVPCVCMCVPCVCACVYVPCVYVCMCVCALCVRVYLCSYFT